MPLSGQGWTTLEKLRVGHRNSFHRYEPGVTGIGTEPHFAIGQRAVLVETPNGNVLWDCISLIDDATAALIKASAASRRSRSRTRIFTPAMAEWSRAFNAPVYLHAADRDWVLNPHPAVRHWEGDTHELLPGVTLIRCGGHFPGAAVLHYAGGAGGKGIVCSGDTLTVAADRKWLSFMRSYPNFIPCSAKEVEAIGGAMAPFAFDALYGHYFDRVIKTGAKSVFDNSVARYLANLNGTARSDGA